MKDYIIKQMEVVQEVAAEPKRAEVMLAIFERLQRTRGRVAVKLSFDTQPNGYFLTLARLSEQE